ncbi:MAG TPA: hypothetical protein VFG54_11075, partial [Prolixibacteraceae bacterium]|nr:hypothetical protein [Prolixibacteraceae bacterium]
MKRLILLLLVLISINLSYGEELNREQQQLAWNFIYENMLSKDYQPTIFKDDITINLKGEITSEDSIVVKDLIKSFQKIIPYLKIELSGNPGNLVLGLKDGKRNTVTTNTSAYHTISSFERFFPTHLNPSQRKQFLYFHLFKGLVFYNFPKENIPEMKGCVFAEQDFQTITYSPFDLFILEKLYAPDFSIQLAKNLPPAVQETAWNNIRSKFLVISKTPVIYNTDIAVKLTGNVSREDSIIMNELIDQVKMIIPNRKIYLASEKGNLEIDFLDPLANVTFGFSTQRLYNEITYKKIAIKFSANTSKEIRKKTLYYHLIRSLADNLTSTQGSMTIPGSVFDEKLPENSSYHPIDAFMVNKLYADDFLDQLKNDWIKRWPERTYYTFMYYNQLRTGGNVAGILLAIILISILLRKGIFKFHEWKLNRFIVQVIWMLAVIDLYFVVSLSVQNFTFLYFIYEPHSFLAFVLINLTILIVTLLFFLIERKLNGMNFTPKERLLYLITNSFIISYALSMALLIAFNGTDNSYQWTILFGISFTVASIVASIRFLLFTFSELKRNELKEKD